MPFPHRSQRFIPARAGNTLIGKRALIEKSVHPRAGGEHAAKRNNDGVLHGSSPRGRGTLCSSQRNAKIVRFIPARAGNTARSPLQRQDKTVHPRAGGEHAGGIRGYRSRNGSSPRGRGTHPQTIADEGPWRFIPARAGNTCRASSAPCSSPVHPRAGGEHPVRRSGLVKIGGSSPRGRGTPELYGAQMQKLRFIPARAGNTRRWDGGSMGCSVHPRAGGEHAIRLNDLVPYSGSSPRGRGTRGRGLCRQPYQRFIPARAGNTPDDTNNSQRRNGSSPRGRGTRKRVDD